MKRLYYITESIQCAESVSDQLHQQGITDWNFHMSHDKNGLKQHHLHSANKILHELDFIRSAERGALMGIFISFFVMSNLILLTDLELSLVMFAPLIKMRYVSIVLFLIVCLLVGVAGAIIGGFVGTLFENARMSRFHDDLAAGKYLLMIDLKKTDVTYFQGLMKKYVDAVKVGEESTIVDPFEMAV